MLRTKRFTRVKCPFCSRTTVTIERKTVRQAWLKYICYKCNMPFQLEKNWRKKLLIRK